jgi:hypothetical protein
MRVEERLVRGRICRPMGDHPGPAIPPYAARRRFARRLSGYSRKNGKEEYPTPSTLNI